MLVVSVPCTSNLHRTEWLRFTAGAAQGVSNYLHTGVPGTETPASTVLFLLQSGKTPPSCNSGFIYANYFNSVNLLGSYVLYKTNILSH